MSAYSAKMKKSRARKRRLFYSRALIARQHLEKDIFRAASVSHAPMGNEFPGAGEWKCERYVWFRVR